MPRTFFGNRFGNLAIVCVIFICFCFSLSLCLLRALHNRLLVGARCYLFGFEEFVSIGNLLEVGKHNNASSFSRWLPLKFVYNSNPYLHVYFVLFLLFSLFCL